MTHENYYNILYHYAYKQLFVGYQKYEISSYGDE